MMKSIFFGVWSCVVTTVALLVGFQESAAIEGEHAQLNEVIRPSAYSEPQTLVSPVIQNSKVTGFVFSRVLLEMNAMQLEKMSIPIGIILQDSYNGFLIGNKNFEFPDVQEFNISLFKQGLKEAVNGSVGTELITSILIEQLSFISAGEGRKKQKLRSIELQTPVKQAVKKSKKKATH